MSSAFTFKRNDITGATSHIPLPLDEDGTLKHIVESLQSTKFQTATGYKADFSEMVDKLYSKITFTGTGFAFAVLKSKISIQFLQGLEFIDANLDMSTFRDQDPAEIFADEKLKQISSDFNYILGLILGKLSLDENNYEFNFKLHFQKRCLRNGSCSPCFEPKCALTWTYSMVYPHLLQPRPLTHPPRNDWYNG